MGEQETAPRGRHAPPLEVRQDRQRARLFAAASAVFARNGFADATAEAIAREAGMSKATFYEHFGNKEECILALFDAAIDVVIEGIARPPATTAATRRRAASAPRCARSSAVVDAFPDQAQTLLVEIIGAGPRAAERRDTALDPRRRVHRRGQPRGRRGRRSSTGSPRRTTRSRSSARSSSSPRGSCARDPADIRELEPVLERLDPRARRSGAAARQRGLSSPRRSPRSRRRSPRAARCPRLVEWRETVAREKRAAFRDGTTGAARSPASAIPAARVLVLGLAPAAHGANRTGRMFTGDRSGDFLFAALHRAGFANQPTSVHRGDGLELRDCFITAAVRCAPPANKPLPERARRAARTGSSASSSCSRTPRVVVCLGAFAWEAALRTPALADGPPPRPRPRFGHGAEHAPRCSAASTRASRTRSPAS